MDKMNDFYLKVIVDLVNNGNSVLDLGCGDGELLDHLRQAKQVKGYGVDIEFSHVLSCIKKGLPAFQGNLDEGLAEFSDASYDYVILSQTLQQVKRPELVMKEMLRVGKKAIVTFPNFAYWQSRFQILAGHTPQNKTLPYHWYNTPNIRVLTISDFRTFCHTLGIRIVKEVPYYNLPLLRLLPCGLFSNFLSGSGMFVLEKR